MVAVQRGLDCHRELIIALSTFVNPFYMRFE